MGRSTGLYEAAIVSSNTGMARDTLIRLFMSMFLFQLARSTFSVYSDPERRSE
jgi:hypothetical protein